MAEGHGGRERERSIETDFPGDRLTWCDALSYCEQLDFAGHTDWRLPNVRELQSIVDYGRFDPSIDPVFGAVSDWYWSSSPGVFGPHRAWFVLFSGGSVDNVVDGGDQNFVRGVRSGP